MILYEVFFQQIIYKRLQESKNMFFNFPHFCYRHSRILRAHTAGRLEINPAKDRRNVANCQQVGTGQCRQSERGKSNIRVKLFNDCLKNKISHLTTEKNKQQVSYPLSSFVGSDFIVIPPTP